MSVGFIALGPILFLIFLFVLFCMTVHFIVKNAIDKSNLSHQLRSIRRDLNALKEIVEKNQNEKL